MARHAQLIEVGRLVECPRCHARIPPLNTAAFNYSAEPLPGRQAPIRRWTVVTLCCICDALWIVRCRATGPLPDPRRAGSHAIPAETRLLGRATGPLATMARRALAAGRGLPAPSY
jgi:hypothetical protein